MLKQGTVWGTTHKLFNKNNVEIHSLSVKSGGYSSKHRHLCKFTKFIVCKGFIIVTVWRDCGGGAISKDVTELEVGDELTISPGDYHQFEALEYSDVVGIYWVSLDENDVDHTNSGGIKEAAVNVGEFL